MRLMLFSVHDQQARAYLPPFSLPSEAMAIREFRLCCNLADHKFCLSPADYSLWHVGSFDQDRGVLEPHDPVLLCQALQFKE